MKKLALTFLLLSSGAALAQTAPAVPTPATAPAVAPAATAPATPTSTAAPDAPAPATAPGSAVVAQIGTQPLTLGEFNSAFRIAVAHVVNQQGAPFDAKLLGEFASARPDYLKQFVRDRALYQLAQAANIKTDAAAVDALVAQAKANFKTDAEYQQALTQIGYLSPEEFRADLERQNVVSSYLALIQKKFTFSDTLVSSFYNLHKSMFTTEAQACVKHILVSTKPEADAVVKQLSAGGDFAKIAAAKSKDPGSAAQGGDLGCLKPGETVPTFDKASFSGPLNKVQVVQSEFGWHILVVTTRTDAGLRPLTDVAPQIRTQLSRDAAQKYLDAQVAKLSIKTFPEVVTVAPAAPKK